MSLETVDDARRVAGLARAEYDNLRAYLDRLPAAGLTEQSACTNWQVYQVVAHISSQPEITAATLEAGLRGAPPMTDEQRRAVWARFDAMKPEEVPPAFRANNDAFFKLIDSLTDDELGKTIPWIFGPAPMATVLASRLNEQALHAWDVKWARDKQATLTQAALPDLIQANIPSRVGRLAKPDQAPTLIGKTINFVYSQPDGAVSFEIGKDGVQVTPGRSSSPDLTVDLPAEALIRLIWGRYDVGAGQRAGQIRLSQPDLAAPLQALFPGF
jgi:uncharacterized protein (TIGR03083 family)